jgi:N-carbamoylputrescine amidase
MRVTVCELNDEPRLFQKGWKDLVRHVRGEGSELVVLPEMPFFPWPFWRKRPVLSVWNKSVAAHDEWLSRLEELKPAAVLGTRPAGRRGKRLNVGFIWDAGSGVWSVHEKYHLPNEPGFWEATWYHRGRGRFEAFPVPGGLRAGFLVCSDLWFFEHARAYGKAKVQILLCPRATPKLTVDKWLAGGRAAAVVSGAFCLSSNRVSQVGSRADLGGLGWIIGPDGEVLGLTTRRQPFVTLDIDPTLADRAKKTYPRYMPD